MYLLVCHDYIFYVQKVSLFSLFGSIPSNVKVVLSFAASSTAYLPFVRNGYVHYRLNGFSQADAKSFSKQYLSTYSKALSAQQEDILSSWVLAKQPRCLNVLLNELVSFGQYDTLSEYMSGYCRLNEVGQFYDSVLRRLSADYGFEEIGRTLLMLSLTLEGFTEDEVKGGKGNHYGIIIPDTVSKEKSAQGKVLAVGEGKWVDGKTAPTG